MTETFFLSIVATGFVVAFAHAAIPTHWLPFVLAGRGQRWGKAKTLMVVAPAARAMFFSPLFLAFWSSGSESKRANGPATSFPGSPAAR